MTVTVMAAMLPELSACSTSCMITLGEAVVVSISTRIQVTLAGTVVWGVFSVGTSSEVACEVGVWPELCSCAGDSRVVGAPVVLVLVSVELWLVLSETEEETSGGEVDRIGGGEVDRARGDEAGI